MVNLRYIRGIPRFAEISGLFGVGLGVENRGLRGTYRQGKCTSHTHMHQKPMLSNSLHSPLASMHVAAEIHSRYATYQGTKTGQKVAVFVGVQGVWHVSECKCVGWLT